ncbi:MAG: hypothetical protein OXH76_08435, partial [Boseongicola sp.]|nr:hypothetical protein [Boseongicola sp.]
HEVGIDHDPRRAEAYNSLQPLYVTCGEHVMRDAHQNMVTAGRHATDVEHESRRICDHFQGEARECQAEFMRRFEPRMCD